jgi:hypothetical protein
MVAEIRYRRTLMQAQIHRTQLLKARRRLEDAKRTVGQVATNIRGAGCDINLSALARHQRREHHQLYSWILEPSVFQTNPQSSPSQTVESAEDSEDDF